MKRNTFKILKQVLEIDDDLNSKQKMAILSLLDCFVSENKKEFTDDGDRVISRAEVAKMMGKSVKAVDLYGKKGIIRRVYITGGGSKKVQSQGYSYKSVVDVISGSRKNVASLSEEVRHG